MATLSPDGLDYNSFPLIALNYTTRHKLSLYLNPDAVTASNWTILAEEMGYNYLEIKNFVRFPDPTTSLLDDWQKKHSNTTVGELLNLLQKIERDDILTDVTPLIGMLGSYHVHSFFSWKHIKGEVGPILPVIPNHPMVNGALILIG